MKFDAKVTLYFQTHKALGDFFKEMRREGVRRCGEKEEVGISLVSFRGNPFRCMRECRNFASEKARTALHCPCHRNSNLICICL